MATTDRGADVPPRGLRAFFGAIGRRIGAALSAYGAFNRRFFLAYGEFTERFWRGVFSTTRRAFDSTPPTRAVANAYRRFARRLGRRMPKGLYARSLIIIIVPIVLLQAVVAFVFMERHWQMVTRRLSAAVTRDIAALVEVIETYPVVGRQPILDIARDQLGLFVSILPPGPLPDPAPSPLLDILDRTLGDEITARIGLPFWIDTVGNPELVEIRIQMPDATLRVFAQRGLTYASNSHIFIVWMVGTSLVLLTIAIMFLRNQILPIERLADAAEKFGKGRPAPDFRPRGATEVRRASAAFLEMRARIERQIEQRTTMLAGVSHDLRTILTRFKLQLAFMEQSPDAAELRADVDEMQRMLEGYLAFARGDAGEQASRTDVAALLDRVASEGRTKGRSVAVAFRGDPTVTLRPVGFRRCITNLVMNAARHAASAVAIAGEHRDGWLTITVDDDGPGVPEDQREAVFRPFYRLDEARNLDQSGTGLGLPIARDIARSHGGDIALSESPMGGLRAVVRIPG